MDDQQLTMLVNSYGIEQVLLDNDIEQEYVLKLLIEEELLDLDDYFETT